MSTPSESSPQSAAPSSPTTLETRTTPAPSLSSPASTSQPFLSNASDSYTHPETSPTSTPTPTSATTASAATTSAASHNHNPDLDDSSLERYYFVFIAAAIIIALAVIWLFLRRRARKRFLLHRTQRSALSRDLASSNIGRGWTYGESRMRHWGEGGGILALARRGAGGGGRRNGEDEGLNESGEAPPPYKASDEGETVVARADEGRGGEGRGGQGQDGAGVAIPLRTLGREQAGLKPPDYSEAVAREMQDEHEPGRDREAGGGSEEARRSSR